jgi:hypothetical protein
MNTVIKDISLSLNPKFFTLGLMITRSSLIIKKKENISTVTIPVYPPKFKKENYVGFEFLTAMVMKNTIFWHVTFSPLKVGQLFGGTYHLHLQGRISLARYLCESRWQAKLPCWAYSTEEGDMPSETSRSLSVDKMVSCHGT